MNDDLLEPRLSRAAALRLAAAGAAGLALGVRPAHAAPSDAGAVEAAARAFLKALASAERARASFPFNGAERTRWHWTVPSSVPRNGLPLGAMSAEQRGLALALLRASSSTAGYRKAVNIMALQGVLGRLDTGIADPVRSRPLLRLRVRHPRRASVGLAVRRAPPLQALHGRQGHARGRAVLPRRLADSRRQRVSVGREGLPDDAARGGRGARDRAPARRRPAEASRVLPGVADRPPHAERCPREAARARWRPDGGAAVRGAATGGRDREHVPREPPSGDGARGARADRVERAASAERVSGGPAAPAEACLTTTGCKGRRSCSSSTTPETTGPTSTAYGATSSATSGDTFCEEVEA